MKPIIYGIGAIIVGIMLFFSGKKDKERSEIFAAQGVTVKGEVQSGASSGGRRSKSYNLEVAYTTKEGKACTSPIKVSKSFYNSIGSDGVVTQPLVEVVYLPEKPMDAIIKGGTSFNPEMQWPGALVALGGLGFLGYRLKRAAR